MDKLARDHRLSTREYEQLILGRTQELAGTMARLADRARRRYYGTRVYLRGIVDVSSICQHDCRYCGQRSSADRCTRYRMRPREILDCCEEGLGLDLCSLVLRSGADRFYGDEMLCGLIGKLRQHFPDCAVTVAMGERSRRSYERLYNAGADRYILLQETADRDRYEAIHSEDLSFDRRLHCLNELKDIGFQTGCGFLVGLPGQTPADLARELKFLEEFQPHSVDLVPLDAEPELVAYLLSIIRLMLPGILLTAPSDPAAGVLAGANVAAAGLIRRRASFPLCGGTRTEGPATIQSLAALRRDLAEIGFEVDPGRDDWKG